MAVVFFYRTLCVNANHIYLFPFVGKEDSLRDKQNIIYTCQTLYSIFEPNSLQNVRLSGYLLVCVRLQMGCSQLLLNLQY